jgi:hypothetical protein
MRLPGNTSFEWTGETTPNNRLLLLYDSRQAVVARALVPLRRMNPGVLAELAHQLDDVFGEWWMN